MNPPAARIGQKSEGENFRVAWPGPGRGLIWRRGGRLFGSGFCGQPGEEAGEALLGLVVFHGHGEGFTLPDEHDQHLAAGDAGVNKVALEQ